MKLALVTDSTCDWQPSEYDQHDVCMVPLRVQVGGDTLLDQIELSSEEFYDRMQAADDVPMTSQPAPGEFIETYNRLAEEGYDEVVSIHIAQTLSGTHGSASLAAQSATIPVTVVDTKNATSGLGLLVTRACELRDAGASAADVAEALQKAASTTHLFLSPTSTDNLVKGGRLSEEQAQGVSLLGARLIFTLDDEGRLVPAGKAKGSKGVVKHYADSMADLAEKYGKVRVRLLHVRNASEIEKIEAAMRETGADVEFEGVDACGAIVATHTGIGMTGFAVTAADQAE